MSQPRNVTTTTNTNPQPPSFLLPSLQEGLNASLTDFRLNPGVGETTTTGIDALRNRGLLGSPVTGAASDLTTRTLQGDFLSPDSNPFLQQTFDRAADLTRTRLDSEFSGAGRNLSAARPARSDELQTLSSNIFGGNFQRERDRQAGAVNQSIPLANQDFTDIGAVLDAGQFEDSIGDQNIDELLRRLGGLAGTATGGTSTSRQPVFNNTFGQVAGGALTALPFLLGASDRRLKSNIRRKGTVKGHAWYEFDIGDQHLEGVMADEVPERYVFRSLSGYDMVNYGALLNA